MKTINFIVLLCFSFLFLHCKNSPTESEAKPLINTVWKLESFNSNGEITKPPESQVYSIRFLKDYTFSGQSDCNEIYGNYTINSENSLTIDSMVTTKIYCGSESFGDNYFEALHFVKSYELVKNQLFIHYGNDSKLNFTDE